MTHAAAQGRLFATLWSAAAFACVALAPLAPRLAALVPPCLFKSVTGVPCPLCGTTRAAVALGKLDPLYALSRFPGPTLFWTGFLAGGLVAGISLLLKRPLNAPRRLPRWAAVGLAMAVLANWIHSIATGV